MPPRRAARNSGPPDNNNSGRVGAAGANRRPPQPQPQPNGARRRISNIRFATIIPVDPEQFRAARQARMERQGGLTVRFAPFSLDDPPVDDEPVEVSDSDESVEVSDSDESTEDGSSEASERPNTDTMAPRPSKLSEHLHHGFQVSVIRSSSQPSLPCHSDHRLPLSLDIPATEYLLCA